MRRFVALIAGVASLTAVPALSHAEKIADVRMNSPSTPDLEIPFACGAQVVVSQGHGTYSHLGPDTWAWDFRAPVGTPIYAAHDGVVRMARWDSTRGGCDSSFGKDANYVVLSYGDGTYETQYLHLSRVDVRVGEKISAGQQIGAVGTTGWSCGAHLHFQLQRRSSDGWANMSVPAHFKILGDPSTEEVVVSNNCPANVNTPRVTVASADQDDAEQQKAEAAEQKPETLRAKAARAAVPAAVGAGRLGGLVP